MVLNQNTSFFGVDRAVNSKFIIKSKSIKDYGIKFPITYDSFLKKSADLELLKSNIKQLLLTRRGQRVMLPNFGTNLKNYLMEPVDQVLFNSIRKEIFTSIETYMPQVRVDKLQIFPLDSRSGGSILKIILFCSLKENYNISFEIKVEIS